MFFKKIDVVDFIDKFGKAIAVEPARCVRLRSKRATGCKDCTSSCPSSAISITGNDVVIDSGKCTECGICRKVCKSGVFKYKNIIENDFYSKLSEQSKKYGHAVLSCIKCKTDNQKDMLSVPCLGWVDSSVLLWSIACGAKNIYLQHDDCNNCKTGCGFDAITCEIENIEKMLGHFITNNNIKFLVVNELPLLDLQNIQTSPSDAEVLSRRELFGYIKKRTTVSIAQALNYINDPSTKQVSTPGNIIKNKIELPVKKSYFTYSVSGIFPELDESADISDGNYIGITVIDIDKCNLCGVCYKFCPTGAIKEIARENDAGFLQKVGISFNADECLKCSLCIDLCTAGAVSCRSNLTPHEYICFLKDGIKYLQSD
jgi:ferredoxin